MIRVFNDRNTTSGWAYIKETKVFLNLHDKRINVSADFDKIRYLWKFTNDSIGKVVYSYVDQKTAGGVGSSLSAVNYGSRCIEFLISVHGVDEIDLNPCGYWFYDIYEVSWIGTVNTGATTAPYTESTVLTVHDNNGVVEGKVMSGKLLVSEYEKLSTSKNLVGGSGSGTYSAEVQYTKYGDPVASLAIQSGGAGYSSAPTISFSGGGGSGATATATVSSGAINSVTLTNAGNGYTSVPTVALSGGSFTTAGVITASLKGTYDTNHPYSNSQSNYLYTT